MNENTYSADNVSPRSDELPLVGKPKEYSEFEARYAEQILNKTLASNAVALEKNSVYGAAVLLPQLARTVNWNWRFTSLVISCYAHLLLCMVLHAEMLAFIAKEVKVWDNYAGEPFLCDFGANVETCHGASCLGPGGSRITPERLYNWDQWATRRFVRDSFKLLFPNMEDQIDRLVDPGEYGMESNRCRYLCVLLFTASVMEEMLHCWELLRLLWHIPAESEPWISLPISGFEEELEVPDMDFDDVQIKVGGMPIAWKIINAFCILLPKAALVYITLASGVCFLMETSDIDDLVINSVALGFLLSIDDLFLSHLMNESAKVLLEKCDDLPLAQSTLSCRGSFLINVIFDLIVNQIPKTLLVFVITVIVLWGYYSAHCVSVDGRWVSKPIFIPKVGDISLLSAFASNLFPIAYEEEPVWTMPGDG